MMNILMPDEIDDSKRESCDIYLSLPVAASYHEVEAGHRIILGLDLFGVRSTAPA
jgi:hypothetical protein